MFIVILASVFFGVLIGILIGLVPGIHPNTVFVIILSAVTFMHNIDPLPMVVFMVSLAVSNTFSDFIPSIFFGAPDPSTSLSVLPAHKMMLSGRGYDALYLTVAGGLGVTLITLISFPVLLMVLPFIYSIIEPHLSIILLCIVLWMIFTENSAKLHAMAVFLLAGSLGIIVLHTFPSHTTLFPAFTGFFALSTLAISASSKTTIPPQEKSQKATVGIKPIFAGWLAGMFAGLLPGTGSAQSGTITAQIFRSNIRDFVASLGGINTSNILFTIIMLCTTGKTRSGLAVTVSRIMSFITPLHIIILCVAVALSAFLSSLATLKIGEFFIRLLNKANYTCINFAIISFLVCTVVLLSGTLGLLIMISCTFIGIFCITSGARRTHLMGFLLLPTILYFSGMNVYSIFF